jgi:hypothetical protein
MRSKGCEIERHVERHAVIAGAAANTQPDAGELRSLDIDAGRLREPAATMPKLAA